MSEAFESQQPPAGPLPQPQVPPEPRKRLFIAGRCGRLANRIVLFANFIAFAQEHGYRLVNFTFHSYAHLFRSTCRDIYCQYPSPVGRSWFDVVPGMSKAIRGTRLFAHGIRFAAEMNERKPVCGSRVLTLRETFGEFMSLEDPALLARMQPARLVMILGWTFRAPGCMQRHADKVRAYFRPLEIHEQAAARVVGALRQQAEVVVGVHIRRGDYQDWQGGKYLFAVERYASWMRELAEQFPGRKVAFLVCSNEPRCAGEFPGLTVGFGADVPIQDLYALAACDFILGPVSTFTQWASFYGKTPLYHVRDPRAPVSRDRFQISGAGDIPL